MKKPVKYLLSAAGVTALSAGVSYAITQFFVKMALDREKPRIADMATELLAGSSAPIDDELARQVAEGIARLEADPGEEVELTAFDGTRLVGHWRPCANPRRVLVAMHGWRSDWKRDFALSAAFWEAQGCSVLYAEQRGQGNSGGDHMGFGLTERYDCQAWSEWVDAHTDESLPIYLCGISMGATTVLMTGALPLPERVHGIMADCGFTSPHAIWRHVTERNLHLSYDLRARYIDRLYREKLGLGDAHYATTDALAANTRPVLFIHGAADTFVPVEMTYENYAACTAPRYLLIVPGAGHGLSYCVEQEKYQQTVKDFWEKYD